MAVLSDLLQRHRLVWLDESGWRQQLERCPGDPQARDCLGFWRQHQLPLVVTRQPFPSPTDIHLGLPMPDRWGRGRLSVVAPLTAIRAVSNFPPAEAVTPLLPVACQRTWRELCMDWQHGGCRVQVYGSHGWQLISGQTCVRAGSDMDLLVSVYGAHHADQIADTLETRPLPGAPRLDGELIFPDQRAVNWREWRRWRSGQSNEILVKRMQDVSLHAAPWWPSCTLHPAAGSAVPHTCDAIGHAAVHALHDELALAPKPGLVSFEDSGSHQDMDAVTLQRSALALADYFVQIAGLGFRHAPFAALQACGLAAERRMLAVTGGINTHRGAIFMLGLLCAAAGRVLASGGGFNASAIRAALCQHWGAELAVHAGHATVLPGGSIARRHGLAGAAGQAAYGFPVVFEVGLPALVAARATGIDPERAQLHSFFAMLAVLDDSNLVRRGGLTGLHFARRAAAGFLRDGGALAEDALVRAKAIHQSFIARNLSPGGVADALAATCWLLRLTGGK